MGGSDIRAPGILPDPEWRVSPPNYRAPLPLNVYQLKIGRNTAKLFLIPAKCHNFGFTRTRQEILRELLWCTAVCVI